MATKSILKIITIDKEQAGASLADALEKSTNQYNRNVTFKTKYSDVKKNMISDFFNTVQ